MPIPSLYRQSEACRDLGSGACGARGCGFRELVHSRDRQNSLTLRASGGEVTHSPGKRPSGRQVCPFPQHTVPTVAAHKAVDLPTEEMSAS